MSKDIKGKHMNWDWDKLKEKQKTRQGSWQPFEKKQQQNNDNRNHDNRHYDNRNQGQRHDDEAEYIDFSEIYKKNNRKNNNGNNGNNGNNDNNGFNFTQLPKAPKNLIKFAVLGLVGVWLASGIYIVQPDEAGVVLRFGKYAYTTEAGPHYHLPFPIERVYKPKVTQIKQVEIGFRSQSNINSFQQGRIQHVADESSMLTGDENIVNIKFSVQYRIKPDAAVNYLFNVTDPDAVLKSASEAAMREVIGNNNIDAALTDGKVQIQNDVAILLQQILDIYKVGLEVVAVQMQDVQPPNEVSDAFKDVASAREDKERIINESEAYRNELIPKARGDAAAMINNAQAYKQTRIRQAEGEASRFTAVLEQYNKNPDTTKQRLVYETLENILSRPGMEKIILTDGMQNLMPVLPLAPQAIPQQQNPNRPGYQYVPQDIPNTDSPRTSLRPDSYSSARQ